MSQIHWFDSPDWLLGSHLVSSSHWVDDDWDFASAMSTRSETPVDWVSAEWDYINWINEELSENLKSFRTSRYMYSNFWAFCVDSVDTESHSALAQSRWSLTQYCSVGCFGKLGITVAWNDQNFNILASWRLQSKALFFDLYIFETLETRAKEISCNVYPVSIWFLFLKLHYSLCFQYDVTKLKAVLDLRIPIALQRACYTRVVTK